MCFLNICSSVLIEYLNGDLFNVFFLVLAISFGRVKTKFFLFVLKVTQTLCCFSARLPVPRDLYCAELMRRPSAIQQI